MSDRGRTDDLAGPASVAGPWTCPRCGRENQASWRQCPACESDRSGELPAQREPERPRSRTNPIYVVIGLLVMLALIALAVWVAEPVWTWLAEQWESFVAWVDERT